MLSPVWLQGLTWLRRCGMKEIQAQRHTESQDQVAWPLWWRSGSTLAAVYLLYTFEQGGGVIAYSQTRRLGHYLQINVEVRLFIQLNKELDLTSLRLCGGVVFQLETSSAGVGGWGGAIVEVFCTHCQHSHLDPRIALLLPWLWGTGILTWPSQATSIHGGLHSLLQIWE